MRDDPFIRHIEAPVGDGFFDLLCRLYMPTVVHTQDMRRVVDAVPTCLFCMARRLPAWASGIRML